MKRVIILFISFLFSFNLLSVNESHLCEFHWTLTFRQIEPGNYCWLFLKNINFEMDGTITDNNGVGIGEWKTETVITFSFMLNIDGIKYTATMYMDSSSCPTWNITGNGYRKINPEPATLVIFLLSKGSRKI